MDSIKAMQVDRNSPLNTTPLFLVLSQKWALQCTLHDIRLFEFPVHSSGLYVCGTSNENITMVELLYLVQWNTVSFLAQQTTYGIVSVKRDLAHTL